VTGITNSVDFPVTVGAFDRTFNGMADAFLSELSPTVRRSSTRPISGARVGGDDLAIDATGGNVYVAGHTLDRLPDDRGSFRHGLERRSPDFLGRRLVTKFAPTPGPRRCPPSGASRTGFDAPVNGGPVAATDQLPVERRLRRGVGTIQIDDSSAFTAPLVRKQQNITTPLIYATTGLATTQPSGGFAASIRMACRPVVRGAEPHAGPLRPANAGIA
jgi:hypothetical protein